MSCPSCGNEVSKTAVFCPNCGNRVNIPTSAGNQPGTTPAEESTPPGSVDVQATQAYSAVDVPATEAYSAIDMSGTPQQPSTIADEAFTVVFKPSDTGAAETAGAGDTGSVPPAPVTSSADSDATMQMSTPDFSGTGASDGGETVYTPSTQYSSTGGDTPTPSEGADATMQMQAPDFSTPEDDATRVYGSSSSADSSAADATRVYGSSIPAPGQFGPQEQASGASFGPGAPSTGPSGPPPYEPPPQAPSYGPAPVDYGQPSPQQQAQGPPSYGPPPFDYAQSSGQQPQQQPPPFYGTPPAGGYGPGSMQQQPPQYGMTPTGMAGQGPKDSTTAFLVELIPGIFGFLGIGHMWSGNIPLGVGLLLGWWVFLTIEVFSFFILIGFCFLPLNVIVPILSAFWLKSKMEGRPFNLGR